MRLMSSSLTFDLGKIASHYFLWNLHICFHESPDFPLPGVGRSGIGMQIEDANRSLLVARVKFESGSQFFF